MTTGTKTTRLMALGLAFGVVCVALVLPTRYLAQKVCGQMLIAAVAIFAIADSLFLPTLTKLNEFLDNSALNANQRLRINVFVRNGKSGFIIRFCLALGFKVIAVVVAVWMASTDPLQPTIPLIWLRVGYVAFFIGYFLTLRQLYTFIIVDDFRQELLELQREKERQDSLLEKLHSAQRDHNIDANNKWGGYHKVANH